VLGAVNLLRVFLPGTNGIENCAVVSIAIFVSVIIAKLVGASLPIIAKALKRDPATVGGPFIQSLSDITSLAVYFGIASAMLK
ncbi:MAG: magnesium transporter, partial [Clostridia bacterium]|nr:magnesium transporter [Clostridia bacterium]